MAKLTSKQVVGKAAQLDQDQASLKAHSQQADSADGQQGSKQLPPIVRSHDIFNLVAIAGLNYMNIMYLAGRMDTNLLLRMTLLYFLADMAYVGLFPRCVKSPEVILCHHVASMSLIMLPYHNPNYVWALSYCMLVEINTWLLIAKRTISVGRVLLDVLFYVTWVLLRNVWYPYLVWLFAKEYLKVSSETGTYFNWFIMAAPLQAGLTGLNFHWTFSLLRKHGNKMKQL